MCPRGCCAAGQGYRRRSGRGIAGSDLPGPRIGHGQDPVRGPAPGPAAWRHAGEPEKMGVMDIRPARLEDVPEIAVVHVRSWQAAYQGLLPQAYLDGLDPGQRIGQWERALSAAGWSDGPT
jgi:hypothetical protein